MHWLFYHYFLYLAQNEHEDSDFYYLVLMKARGNLLVRVFIAGGINTFFLFKLTSETFREDFTENNYLVLGGVLSVFMDLALLENFRVCWSMDQLLKNQRYFMQNGKARTTKF